MNVRRGPDRTNRIEWTDWMVSTIKVLHEAGKTGAEIGLVIFPDGEPHVVKERINDKLRKMGLARHREDFWSPKIVKALRRLSRKGLPASAIGREIGCTKDMVVGKMRRLGLRSMLKKTGGIPSPKVVVAVVLRDDERPPAWLTRRTIEFIDLPDEPDHTAVATIDLEPHHCRWPLGDRGHCGDQRLFRSSYCEHHQQRSVL